MDFDALKLAAQSDNFHAFEWLRAQAQAGNKHAQVIMGKDGVLEAVRKAGADEIMFGPVPELKGCVPLVCYFKTGVDADEFLKLMQLAGPNFEMRKLI